MSTITTIGSSDQITTSRAVINNNFSALNTDKVETSVIDTDTTLAANSDAKVPSQKAIKAYVDANLAVPVTSESTTGTTHSLTTTASQKVVVWAKGWIDDGTGTARTVTLKYNGVTKDTVVVEGGGSATNPAFALMYTETPGAATQNITVETSGGTLTNVVIMVLKIRI